VARKGCEQVIESHDHHAGVRALIVAMKPGNAGGAKGCRKVETRCRDRTDRQRQKSQGHKPGVNAPERPSLRAQRSHHRFGRSGCWRPSTRGSKAANLMPSLTAMGCSACRKPMKPHASPLEGKTTNWRAGCGRSASPVRREGEETLPTPITSCSAGLANDVDAGPSPGMTGSDTNAF
jgi:hypothetical protein